MNVIIEHKIHHSEWDEAKLTPEQFIEFDLLYHKEDSNSHQKRYTLCPTFVFDEGSVYVDESWDIDSDTGKVSTSSYASGVMNFCEVEQQYLEFISSSKRELGQLAYVTFTVEDKMLDVFKTLK